MPPYLPIKLAGAEVAGSEISGTPGCGAAYIDMYQLSGERMLRSDLGRRLLQAVLERGQRVEGTNECRIIGPDIFMKDHVEVIPLLAIDKERVQTERLLDLQNGDRVMDLGDCGKRGGQGGRFEGDGGHSHRGAAMRCYH